MEDAVMRASGQLLGAAADRLGLLEPDFHPSTEGLVTPASVSVDM